MLASAGGGTSVFTTRILWLAAACDCVYVGTRQELLISSVEMSHFNHTLNTRTKFASF